MKKYVYPVIVFEAAQSKSYTVLFPDLDIVASGDTVEEAYLRAEDFLKSYLEFAEKMGTQINPPTSYLDSQRLNPKRVVLLADAETKGDHVLTASEGQYKDLMQQFVIDVED